MNMTSNLFDDLGIGIDIVEVDQFREKEYSKNVQFYQTIFSKSEIDYCLQYDDPYPHFAGKFAIKEAVIKSIKTKILPIEIEVDSSSSKPNVAIKDKSYKFHASISNEKHIAIGVIISFKM